MEYEIVESGWVVALFVVALLFIVAKAFDDNLNKKDKDNEV